MANAADALRKLQSGQALSNEERRILGMSPAPEPATDSRAALARLTGGQTLSAEDRRILGLGGSVTDSAASRTPVMVEAGMDEPITGDGKIIGGSGADIGQGELEEEDEPIKETFSWTDPETGATRTFNSAAELSAFVSSWAVGATNRAAAKTREEAALAATRAREEAAAAEKERQASNRRTAQQEFRASLAEFGLGDLADVVDRFIRDDLSPSQIKLELPKTEAYKQRFPGMQALREAGQAVSEATYISMEKGYLQTLAAYGLESDVLGSRKELGTYVANLVSPREFEERVNLAATRVKDNPDVIAQFKTFYPEVDNNALTAYLLNPIKGMDVIKKQVRLAEIGAAGLSAGFKTAVSMPVAEELRGAVGEQDYQTIQQSFEQAKYLSDQQSRLARIEGTAYSDLEAIRGTVGKDIQSQLASQKRAEREVITRFGGRSGVTSTSLKSTDLV
jgi:hypothetical protein